MRCGRVRTGGVTTRVARATSMSFRSLGSGVSTGTPRTALDGVVYRTIANEADAYEDMEDTTGFVGERGGYRYSFGRKNLLETDQPSGMYTNTAGETDFTTDSRGWFCTRIESVRWSVGPAGAGVPGHHGLVTRRSRELLARRQLLTRSQATMLIRV